MINEISTIDVIQSALDQLNNVDYNDKAETEKKVVNAKITLQTYRDKLQNEVDEFDKWAKTQSDIDTSIQLEVDNQLGK